MVTPSIRTVFRESARGKSIARILMNVALEGWGADMRGLVLDLACGAAPSYRRVWGWGLKQHIRVVSVDIERKSHPDLVSDLAHSIPFGDGVADVVVISEFIYIAMQPLAVLQEARRVVMPGGTLILTVPLVFPHTPEPTDYWRFTGDAIAVLLDQAGFVNASIIPFGGRWSASAYLLTPFLRPRWLVRPLLFWISMKLDEWTSKRSSLPSCPIGYSVRAFAPS